MLSCSFTADNVRATLARLKTKTRRLFPQPRQAGDISYYDEGEGRRWNPVSQWGVDGQHWPRGEPPSVLCRYGTKGSRLYMRESYRLDSAYDDLSPREAMAFTDRRGEVLGTRYEADGHVRPGTHPTRQWGRLRPSIHMAQTLSRATLLVTSVAIERLQSITRPEVVAEGLHDVSDLDWLPRFIALWDSINGKRIGGAWCRNPWVFVVGYEEVEP